MTNTIDRARKVLEQAPGRLFSHGAGSYKVSAAEAARIALAGNVLPAALDLAEAEQAWRDYCDGVDIVEEDTANALGSAVDDALAAFFAALAANLPEEKP